MQWLTGLRMRVRALLFANRLDRELDEELRNHIHAETDLLVRRGVPPERAQRDVLMRFGALEQVREDTRDARGVRVIEDLRQDVRQGLRALVRAPGHTFVIVAILALGIGLTSALFAAAYGVLLKPLPYANADRAVVLWQSQTDHPRDEFSPANFLDARDQLTSFEHLGAALEHGLDHIGADGPHVWQAWAVTNGFFDALGVRAQFGRLFAADEYVDGSARVVVLSHAFWQRHFGSELDVLGSKLTLDGEAWEVVGVLPAAFEFPTRKELYVPVALTESMRQQRGATYLTAVGTLAPGVARERAAAELSSLATRLAGQYPRTNAGVDFIAVPLKEQVVGNVRPIIVLLMSAVALLLLVACSNVANLVLARTTGRAREFAVRAALGARGPRLARQMLTEGALLAVAGCAAGLLLAYVGVDALRAFAPADLPRLEEITVEPRVALFAAMVSALTALAFAAIPALRAARVNPQDGLKAGGTRTTAGVRRKVLGRVLVVGQIAFSFMLVIGAGLIVRSFVNLTRVDPGYRAEGVLAISMFLYGHYNSPEEQRTFIRILEERVRAVPGVAAAGVTTALPLHTRIGREDAGIMPEGMVAAEGEVPNVRGATVSPGYFMAMRIPLLSGRLFSDGVDFATSTPVALISESLARRYFADVDPIGRRITVSFPRGPVERQIVGVVSDVRHSGLDDGPRPSVYVPYSQAPDGALVLTVRTTTDPAALARPVSAALWSIAPTLALYSTATLHELRSASLRVRRFVLMLLGLFATSALTLAALGVYGLLSNATAERTREIGVRLALGADKRSILGHVLGNGAALATAGLALGTFGAAAATGMLRSLLYDVGTLDPLTFASGGIIIFAAALGASVLPAWRASRVDPAVTLKD